MLHISNSCEMCLSTLLVLPVTIHLAYITAPVIKTDDTIIANNKHFTKDNKASTRWQSKTTRGPREDPGNTHAWPTITAGTVILLMLYILYFQIHHVCLQFNIELQILYKFITADSPQVCPLIKITEII